VRTLSTAQQAAVDGPVTEPQYIVKIQLDQLYYWSTRSTVVFGGNTYTPGNIQLGRVAQESCEIQVYNTDYGFTRGAQDGDYLRGEVEVYWAYGPKTSPLYVEEGYWEEGYTETYDATTPVAIRLFKGVINSTPDIGEWLRVMCSRTPPRLYPFRKLRPPLANHLPSAGYVLQFDGNVLRIEA
jgi:hypothetical protein